MRQAVVVHDALEPGPEGKEVVPLWLSVGVALHVVVKEKVVGRSGARRRSVGDVHGRDTRRHGGNPSPHHALVFACPDVVLENSPQRLLVALDGTVGAAEVLDGITLERHRLNRREWANDRVGRELCAQPRIGLKPNGKTRLVRPALSTTSTSVTAR